MDKILVISILFLCLVGIVAAEPAYTFKQDQTVDLKIPCEQSDGEYCGTDVNCTITVLDPSNNAIVDYKNMTRNPSYYNYTIPSYYLLETEEYTVIMNCMNPTKANTISFTFEVTPSGEKVRNIIPISLLILIILFGMLGFSIYLDVNDHEFSYVLGNLAAVGILAWSVYNWNNGLYSLNNIYTQLISIICGGIAAYVFVVSNFEQIGSVGGKEWRG